MKKSYLSVFLTVFAVAAICALTFSFWASVLLGGVVAALLLPFYRKICLKVKSPGLAAGITTFLFFVVILTPVAISVTKAGVQFGQFLSEFQNGDTTQMSAQKVAKSLAGLEQKFQEITSAVGVEIAFRPVTWVRAAMGKGGAWLLEKMTAVLSGAPVIALELFIFVLSIFYFIKDGTRVKNLLALYWPYSSGHMERLKFSFQSACRSIVLASVFTGLIQSVIICIGAAIAGFEDLFLIGTITFLCSFVPVIGASPLGFILAIQQAATGQAGPAIALVVASVIAGSIDNIIRPLLMAGGSSLHPLLSFMSIIGGIGLFGLPGLFIGPILAQVSISLIEISRG